MSTEDVNTGPFEGRPPLRTWEAHGLRCALMRAPIYGAINGYVYAPDLPHNLVEEIDVHGGVTFEGAEWIGFDTLHSCDKWADDGYQWSHAVHTWTEDSVAAETERMAAHIQRLRSATFCGEES